MQGTAQGNRYMERGCPDRGEIVIKEKRQCVQMDFIYKFCFTLGTVLYTINQFIICSLISGSIVSGFINTDFMHLCILFCHCNFERNLFLWFYVFEALLVFLYASLKYDLGIQSTMYLKKKNLENKNNLIKTIQLEYCRYVILWGDVFLRC